MAGQQGMSNRRRLRPRGRIAKQALEELLAREVEAPVVLDDTTQDFLARMYAKRLGHHGVNAYLCDTCNGTTVTLDVHVGVTPMFLSCYATDGCRGMASSSGYPEAEPPASIRERLAWSWYRPGPRELAGMSQGVRDHVAKGGLCLRPWLPSDRSAYDNSKASTT